MRSSSLLLSPIKLPCINKTTSNTLTNPEPTCHDQMDVNHDGVITRAEYEEYRPDTAVAFSPTLPAAAELSVRRVDLRVGFREIGPKHFMGFTFLCYLSRL